MTYNNGTISFINGEQALRFSIGDELYDLAEAFRNQTDVMDSFLADPDATQDTGWFQVVCQRNCYVVQKVIPSSRCMVGEWYDRYMETSEFDEKTGEDIENIMNANEIEYVLVNADNYSKLDETDSFSVFMNSISDAFRIYKIK